MCATVNGKFQFFLTLLISINLLTVALSQADQCQGFGGYCLHSWDCCSNICMSYLYKCTRPRENAYPIQITFEELMEAQFGKPTTDVPNELEERRDIQSRFGEDSLLEGRQLDLAEIAETTTLPFAATEGIVDTQQAETTSTASPNSANCKEIGEKCYRNSECCTERCHGFLHRCVT